VIQNFVLGKRGKKGEFLEVKRFVNAISLAYLGIKKARIKNI
jgi:hypothetical protein